MVQILDDPVPQTVEQLADVLKLFDTQSPVEQVIDVPKIILDQVSQRSSLRVPKLAEELVEVPVPSSRECFLVHTEYGEEIMALARGAAGRTWFLARGPRRTYWWMQGTRHTQWRPPEGLTASPGRKTRLRFCAPLTSL